jgi:exosortase/archaeosortase family protein
VVSLLVIAPRRDLGSRDLAVAGIACLSFLAPVPAASWLGIVLIAFHLLFAARDAPNRAAAALAFALTIPVFWSRLVFMFFSAPVLAMDARLVAMMVGTTPEGNLVPFADGSGAVVLEPGCSSLANLSLALLSASLFLHMRQGRWTTANISWMVLSLLLVLTINVFRIGLIGLYPDHYQLIHGPIGATVAGWLTVAAILLVGYHRIGRHALRPA